jgi:hypothetical protein
LASGFTDEEIAFLISFNHNPDRIQFESKENNLFMAVGASFRVVVNTLRKEVAAMVHDTPEDY